jgi:hypothetical protein
MGCGRVAAVYPISFEADYEAEGRNRLTTLFRFLVVIPWAIVGLFWILAGQLLAIAAWFAILASGRYPKGMYDFDVRALRLLARVNGLFYLLTDRLPSFDGDPDDDYPIRLFAQPPKAEYSRLKVAVRPVVAIPVILLAYVHGVIGGACATVGWFAILFTGRLPESLFRPIRAAVAYQTRAAAYLLLLTEDYPPFDYEPTAQRGGA